MKVMSDRPPLSDAEMSDSALFDLRNSGPSVKHAVLEAFRHGKLKEGDYRTVVGQPGWYMARVSYRSVLFRFMEPHELQQRGRPQNMSVAIIAGINDIPLPAKPSLLIPLGIATVAFVLGIFFAPDALAASSSSFFGTSAQVIATVFIALALEARAALVDVRLAWTTVAYVALGLMASVIALLPGISASGLKWLLAFTVAGGMGALVSTLLIAGWSLARN
jgi:hypothetical protein